MRRAKTGVLAAIVTIGCAGQPDKAPEAPPSPPPAETPAEQAPEPAAPLTFRDHVKQAVEPLVASAVKGIVVGAIREDERWTYGFGTTGPEGRTPDGNTIFRIASLTKPFTALLAATMAADKKIDLDKAAGGPIIGRRATYRALLTHTSGLPRVLAAVEKGEIDSSAITRAELELGVRTFKLPKEKKFLYSTVGYGVLGERLARIARTDLETAFIDRILEPLQMGSTFLWVPTWARSRYAFGYDQDGALLFRTNDESALAGSGALKSTAWDLLTFLSANIEPESTSLKRAIEISQEVYEDIPSFDPSVAGLGWQFMKNGPYYWHSGISSGYRAFMAFHKPSKTGIVVLANSGLPPEDSRLEMMAFGLLEKLR